MQQSGINGDSKYLLTFLSCLAQHLKLIIKTFFMNKRLYITLVAFILCATSFAQPVIKAQKDLGGHNLDFFTCMALTKDGGRIVGGYSRSNISGQKTDSSRGSFDYWVIKLDSVNKIEWDKTI